MVSWSSSGGLRVDLGDAAGFLVEQLWIHGRPATEVGDRPQLGRYRKLVADTGGHCGIDRAESGSRPYLLGLRGVLEVLERDSGIHMRAAGHHRDWVLDLDRLRGVDVGDRLSKALGSDRLVLITDQDVTAALNKDVGRLAPRPGTQLDVLTDQLVDEVQTRLGV